MGGHLNKKSIPMVFLFIYFTFSLWYGKCFSRENVTNSRRERIGLNGFCDNAYIDMNAIVTYFDSAVDHYVVEIKDAIRPKNCKLYGLRVSIIQDGEKHTLPAGHVTTFYGKPFVCEPTCSFTMFFKTRYMKEEEYTHRCENCNLKPKPFLQKTNKPESFLQEYTKTNNKDFNQPSQESCREGKKELERMKEQWNRHCSGVFSLWKENYYFTELI